MQIKTADDVKQLGTILSIWAHPDDETFSCGGIMSTAVNNGQPVTCITATKGERGVQDPDRWPPSKLGGIRAEELAEALSILGIEHHHWLGYGDGTCETANANQAAVRLAAFVRKVKPDTILTWGPEGMTGHPDHCAVSRWVDQAVQLADSSATVYHAVELRENYDAGRAVTDKYNFFFNIDKPPIREEGECDILFKLSDELLVKKYQALLAMPSQYEKVFEDFGQEVICRMICSEAFVAASPLGRGTPPPHTRGVE